MVAMDGVLALLAVSRTAAISLKGLSGVLQCMVLKPEPVKPARAATLHTA